MLRFFLIVLAVFLAMRIIRGIIAYLFPQTKSTGGSPPDSSGQEPPQKPKEYTDVEDAKFKDL